MHDLSKFTLRAWKVFIRLIELQELLPQHHLQPERSGPDDHQQKKIAPFYSGNLLSFFIKWFQVLLHEIRHHLALFTNRSYKSRMSPLFCYEIKKEQKD